MFEYCLWPGDCKAPVKTLGDMFRKYGLDKVSALGEINSQSKQGMCYESTNTVRGRVKKKKTGFVSANEQQIHSVWCYNRKQAK